jgi:hypothetical protein
MCRNVLQWLEVYAADLDGPAVVSSQHKVAIVGEADVSDSLVVGLWAYGEKGAPERLVRFGVTTDDRVVEHSLSSAASTKLAS